jgi:hypothetical protein
MPKNLRVLLANPQISMEDKDGIPQNKESSTQKEMPSVSSGLGDLNPQHSGDVTRTSPFLFRVYFRSVCNT